MLPMGALGATFKEWSHRGTFSFIHSQKSTVKDNFRQYDISNQYSNVSGHECFWEHKLGAQFGKWGYFSKNRK